MNQQAWGQSDSNMLDQIKTSEAKNINRHHTEYLPNQTEAENDRAVSQLVTPKYKLNEKPQCLDDTAKSRNQRENKFFAMDRSMTTKSRPVSV
jgi:hypothetical protein